jgi:hypothetical protein
VNEAKESHKRKSSKQIIGKFNDVGSADKIKKKYNQSLHLKAVKRQEAEIQGPLHLAQANLGYYVGIMVLTEFLLLTK